MIPACNAKPRKDRPRAVRFSRMNCPIVCTRDVSFYCIQALMTKIYCKMFDIAKYFC